MREVLDVIFDSKDEKYVQIIRTINDPKAIQKDSSKYFCVVTTNPNLINLSTYPDSFQANQELIDYNSKNTHYDFHELSVFCRQLSNNEIQFSPNPQVQFEYLGKMYTSDKQIKLFITEVFSKSYQYNSNASMYLREMLKWYQTQQNNKGKYYYLEMFLKNGTKIRKYDLSKF